MPRCRLVLFTYQGELINPLNLKSLPNSYLIAQLGLVTPDEEISRLYMPEIKLHLIDTEDDNELRLPEKVRTLNTLQTQANRSEQTIDPVMRAKCFNQIIEKYPDNYTMASDLCSKISSTMPAQCYITMRSEYSASDIVAQVVCTKALSPRPLECFKQGKERLGVDEALIAIACSGASSFAPLDCLELVKAKSESIMESTLPYKICARAQDSSPAECLVSLMEKRPQSVDQALILCPHHK
jgi:hypothetical protein